MESPSLTHCRSASPVSPSLRARNGAISPSLLPEALRQSPEQQSARVPDEAHVSVPEMQLPPSAQRVSAAPVPVGPPPPPSEGPTQLLSNQSSINADEEYSRDEDMLNQFIKLHPMLSMEATTSRTMQLVAGMLEKAHVRIPDLEEVGKAHDDQFFSEAKAEIGERPCVCGQRCLANHMAKIRYGPDTDKGFVCKEFLLPGQLKDFLEGKGLPPVQQKCLLCSRYWLNYVYILARTDSNFKLPASMSVQTFQNKVGGLPDHAEVCSAASSMPTHTSLVACQDGYHPHAMLFVDEDFAQRAPQRESSLSALCFKPVVRFCSTHYRYVSDEDGKTRIVQVGIGVDEHLDGLGFRQPLSREAASGAADPMPRETMGYGH